MSDLSLLVNILPFIAIALIELASLPISSRYISQFERYFEPDEYVKGDWSSVISEHEALADDDVEELASEIEDEASTDHGNILADTKDYIQYVSDFSRVVVNLGVTAIAVIILLLSQLLTANSASDAPSDELAVLLSIFGVFSIILIIYSHSKFRSIDPHEYSRTGFFRFDIRPGRAYVVGINLLAAAAVVAVSFNLLTFHHILLDLFSECLNFVV